MHRNLLSTFVIDAPSDVRDQTVEFWAAALGADAQATRMANYHILDDAAPPNRIVVQDVGTGPAGVHFDIHTDDLDAEIARLEALGATMVDPSWADHPGKWVIMRDPAGMEFCVVFALNELRPQADRDAFERRAKDGRGVTAMNLPIEDVIELGQLCAAYSLKMTQGDIDAVIAELCTDDGTYSAFGETYSLADWPALVEAAPKGLFLTGEPVLSLDGDSGTGEVPLLFIDQTNHHMRMGWYTDTYRRTDDGWRLATRKMTFLRRSGGADSGNPHDPRRPKPTLSDS